MDSLGINHVLLFFAVGKPTVLLLNIIGLSQVTPISIFNRCFVYWLTQPKLTNLQPSKAVRLYLEHNLEY